MVVVVMSEEGEMEYGSIRSVNYLYISLFFFFFFF